MRRRKIAGVTVCVMLMGCATASKDIAGTYVSPMQYQQYDCRQLIMEGQRVQGRVTQLGGRLDEAASNDKAITGVGIVLFWPALFALGGTKQQEAEYARLKGEYDAVQQASIANKCDGFAAQSVTASESSKQVETPKPPVDTDNRSAHPSGAEAPKS